TPPIEGLARRAGTLDSYAPFYGLEVIPPIQIAGYPSLSQGIQYYGPENEPRWTADGQKVWGRHTFDFGGSVIRTQFVTDNRTGSGTFIWETGQYYWNQKNPITGQAANMPDGAIPPDYNNLAPRFGAAYQINPKTVVRSSYGIFYDTFGLNYAQQQQGNRGN